MLRTTLLPFAMLLLFGPLLNPLLAEDSVEEFDPRKPPDDKVVKAEVKAARKAWKKADAATRKELLSELGLYNCLVAAQGIAALLSDVTTEEFLHGLALYENFDPAYVSVVLPKLVKDSEDDNERWLPALELAVAKNTWEVVGDLRKRAEKEVAADDPSAEAKGYRRHMAIIHLGKIPHEGSLKLLVQIMERYRALERQRVEHGSSGDPAWPLFYTPARTSFNQISGASAENAAKARIWLINNPDFAIKREARMDPNTGKRLGKKPRKKR